MKRYSSLTGQTGRKKTLLKQGKEKKGNAV
jgi:hypothetical protein